MELLGFMMKPFLIRIVLLSFASIISGIDSFTECHSGSQIANISLATKTPYRFIANRDDTAPTYEGCRAVKFWSMIRHGTRNPGDDIIRNMNAYLPLIRDQILQKQKEGKGRLCSDVVRQLSKWTPEIEETDEKKLAHEGEDELLELAERFQKRFPELLPETYSNSTFRFYKLCDNWRRSVDKNPEASKEQNNFSNGPEMTKVQQDVSNRLGLSELLSVKDITLIYVTCAFETAWFPKKNSPWCSLLSDYDFEVLEYAEDLDNYWIDGYGYKINYEQACPTIKDMFEFFSSSNSTVKSSLYFSHAGTLLKMLAHLGLYKDPNPLLASNFRDMLQKRQWRVSRISSFASNIAFVLYRCDEETESKLKILTLHQERAVRLPGCSPDEDLCSMDLFKEAFSSSILNCDFESMCTWIS